jgi:hypothetical protein
MAEPVAQKAEADDSRGSFIGISLAVGANFLVSVSLNVQKYAHNRNTQVPRLSPSMPLPVMHVCC